MKILFVASECNVFDVDSGGAMRNNLFVEALSRIGHVDIISFHQEALVSNIDNCDVIYSEVINNEHHYIEFARTWLSIAIRPESPFSYYRVNKRKASVIDRYVKKNQYDIIACRYIDNVVPCGLLRYADRLVIDTDDHPANKLNSYIPSINLKIVRWKKQFEMRRIGRMAEKLLDGVACSFYSNITEKPSARSVYLHNTIQLNGTNTAVSKSIGSCILYVGYLTYYPSSHGICHFVEKIFPLIRQRVPNASLRVVGKGDAELLSKLNEYEGVEAVGYVKDITPEYERARVVIVPIYYGTGTAIKFVEGMAMNRPVVSTPTGARGFDKICQDGEHYLLARNDEEFADKTVELLSSLSLSTEMAKNGYAVFQKHFSKERFFEIVKETIEKSIA